ncbi:MAG TPA: hypothetical protein VF275_12045 [Gammaproteobacteria bacterium]
MANDPTLGELPEDDQAPEDNIPELEDVVDATPDDSTAKPPPNLDLFADSGLDTAAVRNALAERLAEELEGALGELREEFEEVLRQRVESRLRERLPAIVDDVLTGKFKADNSNNE